MRRLQAAAGLATCASGMMNAPARASEGTSQSPVGLRRFPSDPAPPSAPAACNTALTLTTHHSAFTLTLTLTCLYHPDQHT